MRVFLLLCSSEKLQVQMDAQIRNPLQDKLPTKISETILASPDTDASPQLAQIGHTKAPVSPLRRPSNALPGSCFDQAILPHTASENDSLAPPEILPTSSN